MDTTNNEPFDFDAHEKKAIEDYRRQRPLLEEFAEEVATRSKRVELA
jgi:hypothetical protein